MLQLWQQLRTHPSVLSSTLKQRKQNLTRTAARSKVLPGAILVLCKSGATISASRLERSLLTATHASILRSTKRKATILSSAGMRREALIHPAALRVTKASVTASGPSLGNGTKSAMQPLQLSHLAMSACHQSALRKLPPETALSYILCWSWLL